MRRYSRVCGDREHRGRRLPALSGLAAVVVAAVMVGGLTGCSLFAPDVDRAGDRTPSNRTVEGADASAQWPGPATFGPIAPKTRTPIAPVGAKSRTVKDRYPDARRQGDAPRYADIALAAVEDLGREVRLVIAFGSPLPARMPNETTTMIVSWNIVGDSRHPTRGFSVQATTKGWRVDVGDNDGVVPYPGTYSVHEDKVELKFPWSFLGGRRDAFTWSASSSWNASDSDRLNSSDDSIKGRFQ